MSKKYRLILIILTFLFTIGTTNANLKIVFKLNGIRAEVLKNVQKRLDIVTKSYEPLTAQKIDAIYKQSPQEIREALQPYGYFHSDIRSKLTSNKDVWTARFDIISNTPIRILHLTVKIIGPGKNNNAINKTINNFPLKVGDIFRSDTYEKAKEALFQIAINNGYITAQFTTHQIIIDTAHNTAKIKLILNTGPQFYFGRVNFQSTAYSYNFLKRFIPFNEDTPFSSEKLLALQQAIVKTRYFQKVLITPDFKKAIHDSKKDTKSTHPLKRLVPVTIFLIPPKAKRYSIGIGYGTFTGPRLTTYLSLQRPSDAGQHLEAQLKLSSVLSGLAAKYYIPGQNPINNEWSFAINYQRFLPKNGSSNSAKITGGYTTKLDHTQTTIDLNYLIERYKVKDQNAEKTQLLYPNLNFNYSKSDDLINPTSGKAFNLILRGTSNAFLSSTSFFQTEVKAKYFFTPFSSAHLIFQTDLGYTITKDLNKLPLSMRFFAGGMNSIRGFSESYIGPGRYLYTGSIEYQHRIKDNWWGAIFYDAGTATNHFGDKIYHGKGLGIIYTSLMGPIKLYVGVGTHQQKNHYAVDFSIGPEF